MASSEAPAVVAELRQYDMNCGSPSAARSPIIATTTIIPFMPDGWAASAGGFPAMTEKVAFLIKDLVLFAVSVYLLRQDVIRASLLKTAASDSSTTVRHDAGPTGAIAGC